MAKHRVANAYGPNISAIRWSIGKRMLANFVNDVKIGRHRK